MKARQGPLSEGLNESEIVERARGRDAAAFSQIVDTYQNRLYGFVRKMVSDPEDAEDIAQETFIRAFQGISRFDSRASVRTWLFRIAHNLCVDRARKAVRSPSLVSLGGSTEDELLEIPDSRWDPQGQALDEELRANLEQAIGTMSEKLKSVLMLHDREDMSYEEIAGVLGIPVGTVKSRLFLARAHLQQQVGAYLRDEVGAKDV